MPITDFINPQMIEAIERLGFQTVLILILIWMINYMIKKNEQRQQLSDKRYEELVKNFIEQMQEMTNKHQQSINSITKGFSNATDQFESVTTEIENRMQMCMQEKEHNTNKIIDKIEGIENLIRNNNK